VTAPASEAPGTGAQAEEATGGPVESGGEALLDAHEQVTAQDEGALEGVTEEETGGADAAAEAETQAAAAGPAVADQAVGTQEESAQKTLERDTNTSTQKLADEAASIIREEMQRSPTESAPAGVVQRGVLETIGSAVSRGAGWIMQNVIAPIRRLASAGWGHVTRLAGRFREAYQQTDAPAWNVPRRAFQAFVRMRDQATQEVIDQQRASRQRAVAEGRMTPAQAAQPSFLERMDSIADAFESGVDSYLGVSGEIVQGAVMGDIIENPTGWNTVGQIAIGFVPYAGQVADIRDLIVSIRKLSTGGWRDPVEWINLVLTGIGLIPGLGDIVKAGGRAAMGFIRETGPTILRRGREIWGEVAQRVPRWIDQAHEFGRSLWNSARRHGNNLLERARGLVDRAGEALRGAREAVEGAIRSAREQASNIARNITESASRLMGRVRRLLGPVGDAIAGAVRGAIARARRVVDQASDLVRRGIKWVQDGIALLRKKAGEFYQRAHTFITETVPNAMRQAREWVEDAVRRGRDAVSRRIADGRRMLDNAYQRARRFIADRTRGLRERAIRFYQERIRPMAGRMYRYFVDRLYPLWKRYSGVYGAAKTLFVNWLRENFGVQLPEGDAGGSQTGGSGTEPVGGPGTEPGGGPGNEPGGGPGTEPGGGPGTEPGGGPGTEPGGSPTPGPRRPSGTGPAGTPTTPTPGQGPGPAIPRRIVIDNFSFSGSALPAGGPGIVQLNQLCSLDDSVKAGIMVTRIEGHTDRVPMRRDGGRYESLDDLSDARADAVRAVLEDAGLETPANNTPMGAAEAQVPRNASNRERGRDRKVVVLWEAR
jgi:flagellar motor protein MotB